MCVTCFLCTFFPSSSLGMGTDGIGSNEAFIRGVMIRLPDFGSGLDYGGSIVRGALHSMAFSFLLRFFP
jgi:hypothetical protein